MSKFKEILAAVGEYLGKAFKTIGNDLEKAVHEGFSFLSNTGAALAKDPVLMASIKLQMPFALAKVAAAVETGGASVLPAAAYGAARQVLIAVGKTAEHELVPVVAAELHTTIAATSAATPEKANP